MRRAKPSAASCRHTGHQGGPTFSRWTLRAGSEWDAFDAATPDDLNRFSQIVCEFHGFDKIDDDAWHRRALRCATKLRSLFEVVHVRPSCPVL